MEPTATDMAGVTQRLLLSWRQRAYTYFSLTFFNQGHDMENTKDFTVCIDFKGCKHSYVEQVSAQTKEQAAEHAMRFARQSGHEGEIKKIKVLESA